MSDGSMTDRVTEVWERANNGDTPSSADIAALAEAVMALQAEMADLREAIKNASTGGVDLQKFVQDVTHRAR